MTAEDNDLATCEGCGAQHSWESTRSTGDGCYECPKCQAEADEAFRICSHSWSLSYDEHGDPGQYCDRCHHIVANDVFPRLFPDVPLATVVRP